MDRESATPTKTPFHAGILSVHSDSATIGPVHRRVLREKKDDFQRLLQEKVRQLQDDAQKYLHSQLSHQRQQQQQQQQQDAERASPAVSRTSLDSVSLPSESPPPLLEDPEVTAARFQQQQEAVDQLRDMYQTRLDQLYVRFQKEWLKNPRETKPIKLPLPCSPDCQYVADCLGRALPQALSEICDKRPKDPIEYLAHWLRKHADNTQQLQQQDVDDMKLKLEAEEQVMLRDRRQRLKAEIGHLKDENERRKAIHLERSRAAETSKPVRQPYSAPEEDEEKTASDRPSPRDEVEDDRQDPRNTDYKESAQDNDVTVTTGSDVVTTGSDVGDVGKAFIQGNTASAATALYTIQEHD